jgi:hypothetical protein
MIPPNGYAARSAPVFSEMIPHPRVFEKGFPAKRLLPFPQKKTLDTVKIIRYNIFAMAV